MVIVVVFLFVLMMMVWLCGGLGRNVGRYCVVLIVVIVVLNRLCSNVCGDGLGKIVCRVVWVDWLWCMVGSGEIVKRIVVV